MKTSGESSRGLEVKRVCRGSLRPGAILLSVVAVACARSGHQASTAPPVLLETESQDGQAPASPVVDVSESKTPTARDCDFAPFAEEILSKETPDPNSGTVKVLGDVNGDDLADYSIEYADRVITMTWVFVQQGQGECWREVYDGAGFVDVTIEALEGWRVINVPFVLNPMSGLYSADYLTGEARAEYDSTSGRYRWVRAANCKDGSGNDVAGARCDAAFEQLKPKK